METSYSQLSELVTTLDQLREKGVDGLAILATLNTYAPDSLKQALASLGNGKAIDDAVTAETPLELQTKEFLEAWIKEQYSFDSVEIVSGLGDAPRISSPRDFEREPLKVHKENEDYVVGELLCARAKEQGSLFGLRDAIVCQRKWEEIPKEWHPYLVNFTETVVKIDGDLCVAYPHPIASGCRLNFDELDCEWHDNFRFPRLPQVL